MTDEQIPSKASTAVKAIGEKAEAAGAWLKAHPEVAKAALYFVAGVAVGYVLFN